jgi:GNAT superfamily N-acetyltransferase
MTQIRKFIPIPSEYIQAVAIEEANFPEEGSSVQSWQWQDQQYQPNTIFSRWVGECNGKIISHAYFIQEPSANPLDTFRFHLAVHPEVQRKGYGTELFQYLNRILTQYAPCRIQTSAREDYAHVRHFLEHRALRPIKEVSLHSISLTSMTKPIDLSQSLKKLQDLGFNFCTLQDAIQQIPEWKIQLASLQTGFRQECQQSDFDFFNPEKWTLPGETTDPKNIFIARYHQHWIGIAGFTRSLTHISSAVHTFSGVLRSHRRNGIAGVLIQTCINSALADGYTKLEVDCQKINTLELVFQHLGYQRSPLRVLYESQLPREKSFD